MNLLVTGAFDCTERELNMLRERGHEVVFMQQEKSLLPCESGWVEGIIGNGIFLSHPIEQFTSLRYIQLTSAGFDRVPMDYVEQHGIEIHNARSVYSIPMAEFALCGVLQLYKQSGCFHENQKAHKWGKHRGLLEIFGKNVCIVGCGSVGTECAKRFRGVGCKLTGVDLVPRKDEYYEKIVYLSELDIELTKADVIVLTLPLTDKTKHLMNEVRFSALKDSAVIVNIARGAVIDTAAMIEALPKIGGAVLDVFEEEPLDENSPLWDMGNVIITPHNSFVSDGNHARMLDVIMNNLERTAT